MSVSKSGDDAALGLAHARATRICLAAVSVLALATACAPEHARQGQPRPAARASGSATADPFAKDQLDFVTAGTFTIGTDKPA